MLLPVLQQNLLDLQDETIRGVPADLAILDKVIIHEELRVKHGKDRDKTTMAEFVSRHKMEQVRDGCRTAHGESLDSVSDSQKLTFRG